jgi:microcystin-dependent protein
MTALTRSALKTLWADHYFPTSGDFSDLFDSFTLYAASMENLGAAVSAGSVGVPRFTSASSAAFFVPTTVGTALITAATSAAAFAAIGATSAGAVVFTASTTALASMAVGSGSAGAHIFSCSTTADAEAIVSLSVVASYPIPVGAISMYTATAVPTGWLACNGQAVSRTTYQDLFTVTGTTFGAGDTSTTFNVPDLRGRIPIGNDAMGTTTAARVTPAGSGITGITTGSTGGAESHTLTTAQIPAHTHTREQALKSTDGSAALSPSCGPLGGPTSTVTGSEGSGSAHRNMPPAIILNYMIRALT